MTFSTATHVQMFFTILLKCEISPFSAHLQYTKLQTNIAIYVKKNLQCID